MEYTKRKAFVIAKAINPEQVSAALQGLAAGFFAVLATLKIKFAEQLTLGYTIGELLERLSILLGLDALLEHAVDKELRKWVPPGISLGCRCGGVLAGLLLSRIVWAFHCSLRGGDLIVFGATLLVSASFPSVLPPAKDGAEPEVRSYWERAGERSSSWGPRGLELPCQGFKLACGVVGFFWQLTSGFALPWMLWLIAFPVVLPLNIAEALIQVAVYWA